MQQISGLARFNEVKSLNVRLRTLGVIRNVFLQFYKHSKIAFMRFALKQMQALGYEFVLGGLWKISTS